MRPVVFCLFSVRVLRSSLVVVPSRTTVARSFRYVLNASVTAKVFCLFPQVVDSSLDPRRGNPGLKPKAQIIANRMKSKTNVFDVQIRCGRHVSYVFFFK